jgi:hypothetical protein
MHLVLRTDEMFYNLPCMNREFARRLHHDTPLWVAHNAVFHIRIRCAEDNPVPLTQPDLGSHSMESVGFYRDQQMWWPRLWLLMPDHVHGLVSFPADKAMRQVAGKWKEYHARHNGVRWQENFFDHRIRNEQDAVGEVQLHPEQSRRQESLRECRELAVGVDRGLVSVGGCLGGSRPSAAISVAERE